MHDAFLDELAHKGVHEGIRCRFALLWCHAHLGVFELDVGNVLHDDGVVVTHAIDQFWHDHHGIVGHGRGERLHVGHFLCKIDLLQHEIVEVLDDVRDLRHMLDSHRVHDAAKRQQHSDVIVDLPFYAGAFHFYYDLAASLL